MGLDSQKVFSACAGMIHLIKNLFFRSSDVPGIQRGLTVQREEQVPRRAGMSLEIAQFFQPPHIVFGDEPNCFRDVHGLKPVFPMCVGIFLLEISCLLREKRGSPANGVDGGKDKIVGLGLL
ncbi:hypothetical protein A0U91_16295 (plasmid) [Acetobacter persici]|uniref:Uncharacterized protein n=1 Tax=Acetobacter persici TaxID=1076596 RepID=A0A1U9LJI7_9PROT|nr:hypothetical protein A0U91_16295 [Acetobacter persici]